MTAPLLSLTEAQAFIALRAFLLGVAPGIEVIRAEANRVPEPRGSDYVVMTQNGQERLGTNEVATCDNVVVGSIAGGVLTVTAIPQSECPLVPGMIVLDVGGPVLPNTLLGAQLSGPTGGTGTYAVTPSQTVPSEDLYLGVRFDLTQTKLTVQLDVHGPASGDNVKVIESLFRSEYATDAFAATGYDVAPLYCDQARQAPFINAEQQYEYRWSVDACLQINPIVGTPQQFADQLAVGLIEVDAAYPP